MAEQAEQSQSEIIQPVVRELTSTVQRLSSMLRTFGHDPSPRAREFGRGRERLDQGPGGRAGGDCSATTSAATVPPPMAMPMAGLGQTPPCPRAVQLELQSLFGRGRGRHTPSGPSSTSTSRPGSSSISSIRSRLRHTDRRERPTSAPFMKDVILLDTACSSAGMKVDAQAEGRVASAVRLHKHMTEEEVTNILETVFIGLIKDIPRPRFEFVKVNRHRVSVPMVTQSHTWTGAAVKHLAGQGDLYIRSTAPLPIEVEELSDDEFPATNFAPATTTSTSTATTSATVASFDAAATTTSSTSLLSATCATAATTGPPSETHRRGNAREIRNQVHRHDVSDVFINILGEQDSGEGEEELSIDEESSVDLRGEIKRLSSVICEEKSVMISVFRGNVLSGALRAVKRPTFDPRSSLDVVFSSGKTGEGAVDMGGPRKEFFRLCLRELLRQAIFEGPPNELRLSLNQNALENYLYKYCGTLVALSLVHGGPGPRCLAPSTYNRIIMSCTEKDSVQDIGDPEMRLKITKVQDASSAEMFDSAIEDPVVDTIMSLNGLHGPANKFENKAEVAKNLIKAIQGNRLEPCFSQFREGLSTLGVLASMRAYPNVWFDPFCVMQAPRSSRELLSLFHCQLAPEGSNKAVAQARTLAWWGDFVADCEAGVTDHAISVGDILTFVTCLTDEPAGGFDPSPSITFTEGKYPEANTCSNILRLPVCHSTYEDFAKNMMEGIIGGQGFGQA